MRIHTFALLFMLIFPALPMVAQEAAPETETAEPAPEAQIQEPEHKLFELHGEVKAHYRWSEDSKFPLAGFGICISLRAVRPVGPQVITPPAPLSGTP